MFSAAKAHTIAKLAAAKVNSSPFPHIFVDGIFPTDFYAEMQARKLPDASYDRLVDTGRVGRGYSSARLCYMPSEEGTSAKSGNEAFWQEFFATYNDGELLQAFAGVFRDYMLQIEQAARAANGFDAASPLAVHTEIFLMRDKEGYELKPHTDAASKLISALFYLPSDLSAIHLGTSLYIPKDKTLVAKGGTRVSRDQFDIAGTMPFRPNTLLAFPNLPGTFHGVENMMSDQTRDVLLYDIKVHKEHAETDIAIDVAY